MKRLDIQKLETNIENIAKYDFENKKVFGSAYHVYQEGNLEIEKCYGVSSLEKKESVTGNTIFRLASMTKPVTGFAAMILLDRKIISLDDPVEKYIPAFKDIRIKDAEGNDLGASDVKPTIRHTLTHSSGIGSDLKKSAKLTPADRETRDSMIDFLIRTGLDFVPDTKTQYSGIGAFEVLSKIIEIVSGTDLNTFFKNEIFEPCGMCDTTFVLDEKQEERLIVMHDRKDNENVESKMYKGCIMGSYPATNFLGSGGLASTLQDYVRFAKMLLAGGVADGKRLISEESFKKFSTPQIPVNIMPGSEKWGLSVRVITNEKYPTLPVNAFGWSGAYGTHFWVDPDNRIIAVYMKNSKVDGGAGNESARKFERAVLESF